MRANASALARSLELGLVVMMEPLEGMGEMEGEGIMAAAKDLLLWWPLSGLEGDSFGDAFAGTDRPLAMSNFCFKKTLSCLCEAIMKKYEKDQIEREDAVMEVLSGDGRDRSFPWFEN